MTDGALFALPPGFEPASEVELSRGQKRVRLVEKRIRAGQHPLSGAGRNLPLHPAAPHTVDRSAPGLRCGTCRWRMTRHFHNKTYPKCAFGEGIRITGSEASDVRGWWPACHDYEEAP